MVLPIAVIFVRLRGRIQARHYILLVVLLVSVSVYSALWSNFVVARGVQYFDGSHVLGMTVGFLPIEHYVFLALQVTLVGVFMYLLWRRIYPGDFE